MAGVGGKYKAKEKKVRRDTGSEGASAEAPSAGPPRLPASYANPPDLWAYCLVLHRHAVIMDIRNRFLCPVLIVREVVHGC